MTNRNMGGAMPPADAAPMDLGLYEVVSEAVLDITQALDSYFARAAYRPRKGLASLSSFAGGWPNISEPPLFPGDGAPVDIAAIFGSQAGPLTQVTYRDVPGLSRMLDYVRGRTDLFHRVNVEVASNQRAALRLESLLDYEIASFPISVVARMRALDRADEATLLDLYCHRERSWLSDKLPVEYWFPLALTALDIEDQLDLGEHVSICRMTTDVQLARTRSRHSLAPVPGPIVSAATHAIRLSGFEVENPGPTRRVFSRDVSSPPFDQADLVVEALGIVAGREAGYAQVLQRPIGWADSWVHDLPAMTEVSVVRRYPARLDDFGWLGKPDPVPSERLEALPLTWRTLGEAPPNVRLAARRLAMAVRRDDDEDRVLDACIGLEALLGEGRDELSHRMALRGATLLATRSRAGWDPHRIYGWMKQVYKHRSHVAHGASTNRTKTMSIDSTEWRTSQVAVILLREVLATALSGLRLSTPEALDAALLDAVASGRINTDVLKDGVVP